MAFLEMSNIAINLGAQYTKNWAFKNIIVKNKIIWKTTWISWKYYFDSNISNRLFSNLHVIQESYWTILTYH